MKKSLIIVFLIGITLCGCGKHSFNKAEITKELESSLAGLSESDPTQDAQKNASNGDFRYAACLGEAPGPYFPSVPRSDWDMIWSEKDYWMIEGTSDAIESHYHGQLIERAVAYAEVYNKHVRKLRPAGDSR